MVYLLHAGTEPWDESNSGTWLLHHPLHETIIALRQVLALRRSGCLLHLGDVDFDMLCTTRSQFWQLTPRQHRWPAPSLSATGAPGSSQLQAVPGSRVFGLTLGG